MAWSTVDDLFLVVHDEHAPADLEWHAWLREYGASLTSVRALIIYSTGGAPTTGQRKALLAVLGRFVKSPTTVVLTSSALVRGVVTAVSWFVREGLRARPFALDDEDRAFAFLAIDAGTAARVRAEKNRLADTLGRMRAAGPE
jgi:hypothetical protein